MKITKQDFSNETAFKYVEAGQVFHFGNNYFMAFGKNVVDDEDLDITLNAIRLNDGLLVCFKDEALVAVVDNVELIIRA